MRIGFNQSCKQKKQGKYLFGLQSICRQWGLKTSQEGLSSYHLSVKLCIRSQNSIMELTIWLWICRKLKVARGVFLKLSACIYRIVTRCTKKKNWIITRFLLFWVIQLWFFIWQVFYLFCVNIANQSTLKSFLISLHWLDWHRLLGAFFLL